MRFRFTRLFVSLLGVGLSGLFLAGCSLSDLQQLKAKSGLQVITGENQAASLYLNGEYLDKTPYISKNIKPGIYSLKIDPTDKTLAPFETKITLAEGALAVITWSPGKTPETSGGVIYELMPGKIASSDKAEISFVTIPENAIVTVDNKPQTFSPLTLTNVEPGNHELEVKLPSYVTQRHTLNAAAGKKLQITVKLAKQNASAPSPTPGPTASQSAQVINPMSIASSSAITQASLSAKLATKKNSTQSGNLSGTHVTIGKTGFTQAGKEVLRVRATADPASATVGYAEVDKTYPYLKVYENGWFKITLSSTVTGWVSDEYATVTE
jgi:hypothetical protein